MESLLRHLTNRTAETLLIINLFHLLLAGLTLLVLLHHGFIRGVRTRSDRLLTFGFFLFGLHFALLTVRFGVPFFLGGALPVAGVDQVAHGLLVGGILAIAAAHVDSGEHRRLLGLVAGFIVLVALVIVDVATGPAAVSLSEWPHSRAMVAADLLAIVAVLVALRAIWSGDCNWEGRQFWALALITMGLVQVLHCLAILAPRAYGVLLWNCEEHLMSLALFAFAWAVGARSHNLLDRVFLRLNLTFLILASLIMLITAGMEKYQYFRLAEERSTELAEYLRGHYLYYSERGEGLDQIFQRPDVLRRVITEFGSLPELREVDVYAHGRRAAFRHTQDWEIKESVGPDDAPPTLSDTGLRNSFQMIRLPIGTSRADRVEFIGTLDYVNAYIGKYIIFIYCSFTLTLGLGTLIIGMIVADTDRQLQRRYTELQEAQQQLAQSAKLASIGELAGGMAHEINNPITSILALASHMAEGDNAGALNPRGRKNLHLIVKQAERVAALVGGMLTFSRQSQLHISRVSVTELLDSAVDLVGFRLKDVAIRVRREFEPNLPLLQGDASRLTEVFVNLLTNAIDAMPAGGTLTVRAFANPADNGVQIEVQDTGQGIAPEHLPRIFDPFFTTKAPGRGTGLGLSISHGIIKDHGGEIWARSQPGVGTTIVMFLAAGANQYEAACSGD